MCVCVCVCECVCVSVCECVCVCMLPWTFGSEIARYSIVLSARDYWTHQTICMSLNWPFCLSQCVCTFEL